MTDYTTNILSHTADVYDCFVQIISGSDRYRLKSLQNADPQFKWPQLVSIGDDGTFVLRQQVTDHRFEQELLLAPSEVDGNTTPTGTRTFSYYLYKKNRRESMQVAVSIVYHAKNSTDSKKFMRLNFTYEVDEIGMPRVNEEGDIVVRVAGIILPTTISFVKGTS